MSPCNRRDFFKRVAAVAAAGVPASLAAPACSRTDPAPIVDGPDLVEGVLALELARYPDLSAPGGALAVRARGLEQPLLLVRVEDTIAAADPDGGVTDGGAAPRPTFAALGAICPHAGCPLGYLPSEKIVECPCHGARFSLSGALLRPPAVVGLRTYPVRYNATTGDVLVDTQAGDPNFPPLVGGRIVVPLAKFPALAMPGGSIVGTPSGFGRPIVVARVDDKTVAALEATCTHLQCLLSYDPVRKDLACPCHASRFDLQGAVTAPPATRPIAAFAVAFDGETITITP